MLTKLLNDPWWSEQERAPLRQPCMRGVLSAVVKVMSQWSSRSSTSLSFFLFRLKENFNRQNSAKLRKKSYYFHYPQWEEDWAGNLWMTIDQLAPSASYWYAKMWPNARHLYCCTDADLAVRSESALLPPFFCSLPPGWTRNSYGDRQAGGKLLIWKLLLVDLTSVQ